MNIKQAELFGALMGKLAAEDQFSTVPVPKKLGAPTPGAPKPPEPPASKPIGFAQQNKMWHQANDVAPQLSGPAPKRFADSEEFQTHAYGMDTANHTANYQRRHHQNGLAPVHMYSSPEEQRALRDAYIAKQQAVMRSQGHGLVSAQGDFADLAMGIPAAKALGKGLYNATSAGAGAIGAAGGATYSGARSMAGDIGRRLHGAADKALESAIKSPITPDYVKKTFYPGFQSVRDRLRHTSRSYGPSGSSVPASTSGLDSAYRYSGLSSRDIPSPVFRTQQAGRVSNRLNAEHSSVGPNPWGGTYYQTMDHAWSSAPKGTQAGKTMMRHELAHSLQANANYTKLPAGLADSTQNSGLLKEIGAYAGQNKGPLNQIGGALSFLTSPSKYIAYSNYGKYYKPWENGLHFATSTVTPLAGAAGVLGASAYGLNRAYNEAKPTLDKHINNLSALVNKYSPIHPGSAPTPPPPPNQSNP